MPKLISHPRKGKLYSKGKDNPLSRKAAREDKKHASRRRDIKYGIKIGMGNLEDKKSWYYQARGKRYFFRFNKEAYLVLELEGEKAEGALLEFVEQYFGRKEMEFGSPSRMATWVAKFHTGNLNLKNKPRALQQIRHEKTGDSLDDVLDRLTIFRCFRDGFLLDAQDEWSIVIEGKQFFFTLTKKGGTVPNGYTATVYEGKADAPVLDEAYVASLTKEFGKNSLLWCFNSPYCFANHAHKFQTKKSLNSAKGGWKQALYKKFISVKNGNSLADILEQQQKHCTEKEAAADTKVEVSTGTDLQVGTLLEVIPVTSKEKQTPSGTPLTHTRSFEPIDENYRFVKGEYDFDLLDSIFDDDDDVLSLPIEWDEHAEILNRGLNDPNLFDTWEMN